MKKEFQMAGQRRGRKSTLANSAFSRDTRTGRVDIGGPLYEEI